ncbi:MAG: PIG-L family deacetylase [Thermoplasmata archaeon]|nr:PIG-L family deacetylase [Thermoplasmata archaeon]
MNRKQQVASELKPRCALIIVAHPDDVEYYCGGTVAKWVSNGCQVSLVVASSGDKGTHDLEANKSEIIFTRESEQRASAFVLGISDVQFLRHPDAELKQVPGLFEQIVFHIRRVKPEVILTHDPMVRLTRQHPDHRAVGQLVIDASFPISVMENCFPSQITQQGVEPWQPDWLLMFGSDIPNYYTDISNTINVKINALKAHSSQESAFPGGMEERLQWRASSIGKKYNIQFAEEFLQVRVGSTYPV